MKTKRIIALVLVLVLAFATTSVFVSAADVSDIQPRRGACPLCGTRLDEGLVNRVMYQDVPNCQFWIAAHQHQILGKYWEADCTNSMCTYVASNLLETITGCPYAF